MLGLLAFGVPGSGAAAAASDGSRSRQSSCPGQTPCPEGSDEPAEGGSCPAGETWREVGVTTFPLPQGLLRTQGITTDGRGWYFSWQGGLERTTDNYVETAAVPLAIPPALVAQGSDHIGDIDYYKGKLIVPIDDSKSHYTNPYLAIYDATTLLPISYHKINMELPDAASWVAVDPKRGLAMTSRWDKPTQINLFDINDQMRHVGGIPLQQPLSRIQGAKLLDGSLIAAVDDAAKSVYRIDLTTGAVTKLFSLGLAGELEGIAVRPTPDGALVHVLLIEGGLRDPQNSRISLHHWARTERADCEGARVPEEFR